MRRRRETILKANKIDIPASLWILILIILTLFIWGSFDKIYASETILLKSKSNAFDNALHMKPIEVNQLTTFDIENEIAIEAKVRDEIKAEELRRLEEARLQAEEEARIQAEQEAARIAAEEARYQEASVCGYASSRKNYMDYRALWSGSTQMRIINNYTTLTEDGFLVTEDGFYGVALGSSFGPLGSKYRFTTDTGSVFKVIKVDEKADAHTVNGCADASGSIIEFVFDTDLIRAHYPQVTSSGDVNVLSTFNGSVVKVEAFQ